MIMAIMCCKGCVAPKRHPGCHDHCPEYAADKGRYELEKAARNRQKSIEDGLTAQTVSGIYKAHRAQRRRKGRF